MSSSRSNRSGSRPRLVVGPDPQPPRTSVSEVPWTGEEEGHTGPTAPLPSEQVTGQTPLGVDPAVPPAPVAVGETPAFLYVERGPGAGQLVPLRQGVLIIGRGSEADLRLVHPSISRKHAAITREGDQFFVRDFGSQNGTFVNQLRSPQEMELFPGDELAVGNAILRLRSRADENDPPRERPFVTGMVMSGPSSGWGFRGLVLAAAISLGLVVALGWALLAGPSAPTLKSSPLPSGTASSPLAETSLPAEQAPAKAAAAPSPIAAVPPSAPAPSNAQAEGIAEPPVEARAEDAIEPSPEPKVVAAATPRAAEPAPEPSRSTASRTRPATRRTAQPAPSPAVASSAPAADSAKVLAVYEKGDIAQALTLARASGDTALLRKLERFQRAYSAGHRALSGRDGIGAIRNFAEALKADESISRGWGSYGPELRDRLATLYVAAGKQRQRTGDVNGAREAFKAALAYDAKNAAATQALAQLGR